MANNADNEARDVEASLFRRALGVFGYTHRAVELVWTTSRPLTLLLAVLTLAAGILPAAVAWIGRLIVDGDRKSVV